MCLKSQDRFFHKILWQHIIAIKKQQQFSTANTRAMIAR